MTSWWAHSFSKGTQDGRYLKYAGRCALQDLVICWFELFWEAEYVRTLFLTGYEGQLESWIICWIRRCLELEPSAPMKTDADGFLFCTKTNQTAAVGVRMSCSHRLSLSPVRGFIFFLIIMLSFVSSSWKPFWLLMKRFVWMCLALSICFVHLHQNCPSIFFSGMKREVEPIGSLALNWDIKMLYLNSQSSYCIVAN